MQSIRIRHLFFALLAAAIFVQCASIAQPQGGPRDSLPPLIISTVPAQRAVNFKGKQITLNFNEYVTLQDQQKEFIVSPPTLSGSKPSLTVKGRSILVDFSEQPDSNTTYRLDFGNAIADNNEGNRLGNYAYVFSTGPELDTLLMSGLTIDAQTRDSVIGALVFFFDARADFLPDRDSTLFNARADAVFRSDSSGFFLADILRDKDYRVYAILDKNGNQRYESGADYVAILDSVYNPTRMPDFDMWIEPATGNKGPRRQIDPPQLRFELFMEEPVRRQTIIGTARPERQKLQIIFNSIEQAQIVSFRPAGIDSTWLKRENGVKGDTVWYWIAPPTQQDAEALQDTIRATISYMTQDSLWRPQLKTEELSFVHRVFDPNAPRARRSATAYADSVRMVKEAKRKAKRAARLQKKWLRVARAISRRRGDPKRTDAELLADTTLFKQVDVDTTQVEKTRRDEELPPKNPFGFKVMAANPLNPETHIRLLFDYPLRSVDEARIRLTKLSESQSALPNRDRQSVAPAQAEKVEEPEPFTVELDSATHRLLTIRADWKADDEYGLLIPDSVFRNIAFQANDTLQSTFKVADSSKFGTVIIDLKADEQLGDAEYILELLTADGKVSQRIKHATAGRSYKLRYLTPTRYQLRVTEDRNKNGEWDTGSLVQRRQPERIRYWEHPASGREIIAKENWDVAVPVDLRELFDQF